MVSDVLCVIGSILFVAGLALWYPPVAITVTGLIFVFVGASFHKEANRGETD